MPSPPPRNNADSAEHLREAAVHLADALENARRDRAARCVRLAVRAIGPARPGAVNDNSAPTDVDLDFELDEHDRVWMIREGDCHIIGRRRAVEAEMWRFLRFLLEAGR